MKEKKMKEKGFLQKDPNLDQRKKSSQIFAAAINFREGERESEMWVRNETKVQGVE